MKELTKAQRHKIMSHVRSKDTRPELCLRKSLWHAGIHYRKNYKALPGKPDIVLTKYKVAIFVDGDFWHGRDLDASRIHNNRRYWVDKIHRNMKRDKSVNDQLSSKGWTVIRLWESEIKKDLPGCVKYIKELIWSIKMDDDAI